MSNTYNAVGFPKADGTFEEYANELTSKTEIVAPVEVSPTSTTHSAGDYLRYNGIVYKAKTDIAANVALTVGTNIIAASFQDGISIFTPSSTGKSIVSVIDNGVEKVCSDTTPDILNSSGTTMTRRDKFQFGSGLSVSDDSTNGKTIITTDGSSALKTNQASYILTTEKAPSAISTGKFFVDKDGVLRVATSDIGANADITNSNSSVKTIGEVLTELNSKISDSDYETFTTDGVKTWKELLNELYNKIDFSKVTKFSRLSFAPIRINRVTYGNLYYARITDVLLDANNSHYITNDYSNGSWAVNNASNNVPGAGVTFYFYY